MHTSTSLFSPLLPSASSTAPAAAPSAGSGMGNIKVDLLVVGASFAGLAWGASVAGVPSLYIGIGVVILLGIGIFSAVSRTRSKDPS